MHDGRSVKNKTSNFISFAVILGPVFIFSPEWSILLGGVVGGTIAYLIGEKMSTSIVLAILVTSLAFYQDFLEQ